MAEVRNPTFNFRYQGERELKELTSFVQGHADAAKQPYIIHTSGNFMPLRWAQAEFPTFKIGDCLVIMPESE